MARPLSWAMARALAERCPLILFAEIEHPSGTGRFCSADRSVAWAGQSWAPAGALGTISPIEHSTAVYIQEIQFTLRGADPEVIAKLSDDVRNRAGRAWLGCLNDMGAVVEDPIQLVDAELDYQSFRIEDDGATATIQITARSGFYTLERALDDVWSDEDHKTQYPLDSGLSLISGLQNQELIWGPAT